MKKINNQEKKGRKKKNANEKRKWKSKSSKQQENRFIISRRPARTRPGIRRSSGRAKVEEAGHVHFSGAGEDP